ncbi:MAG TPA: endonuclease MutS2, partial [Candidatus Kapabacteria bacterium]|nr:endonuclease MutS2 [Candidatus Kapabacteria bacterium]
SLAEIREMRGFLAAGEAPRFSGLADISSTLRKLEIPGSTLYAEEGSRMLAAMKAMRTMREFFSRRASEAPILWKSGVQLFEDRILEMHFDQVFDDAGNVKDSASVELARIRREILTTEDQLRARLGAILARLSEGELLREEIITQREGRFVVPVKVEHKRRVPGFIHSVSQTGQTVFIEPSETLELNNELRSLEFSEQREIDRVLRGLADRAREAVPPLRASLDIAAHLDAVHAKSAYALQTDSNDALLEEQSVHRARTFELKDARHPLLLEKLGRDRAVPLTILLDEEHRALVLTGPNAGGKTVLLKTIGLLSLMAHAGLPIPAAPDGRIPKMDGIYVEIGDAQSIADDLSTFSSHVTSLAEILTDVTRSSLVLLDEIGGGTAPEEGGAIAESILEQLLHIGAFTIATTHYGRLAAYAETAAGAGNGSMEFDRENLTPTFRFRMGVPGSSHAFDIAERFGLKHGLVEHARELRGEEGARIEDLIASLESLERDARERENAAARELGAARAARIEFERKLGEVETIRRTAKARASEEAEEILKRANQFIERAVREAKEAVGGKPKDILTQKEDLRALRARQEQERKEILQSLSVPQVPTVPTPETELAIGSNVRLKSNPGQIGKVLSIKENEIEIEIGSLRMRTKSDQLEIVTNAEAKSNKKLASREVSQTTKYLAEAVERRIDLRGEYGDDAVLKVDRLLADASAHGLDRLEIIHGHGTGALGRRISQHLKGHNLVQSYRYGEPHEGGSGVTIVELK